MKNEKEIVVALISAAAIIIVALINNGYFMPNKGTDEIPTSKIVEQNDSSEKSEIPDLDNEEEEDEQDKQPIIEEDEDEQTDIEDEEKNEVRIEQLVPLKEVGGIGFWQQDTCKDNLGNDGYDHMVDCYPGGNRFITYPLDQKYSVIEGVIALSEYDKNAGGNAWLKFYDGSNEDKKLIGETDRLKAGVRPFSFSVRVSNIRDLTIVACSDSDYGLTILAKDVILKS